MPARKGGWLTRFRGSRQGEAPIARIAPWLLVGPALPTDRLALLRGRGVTHVVDLRVEASDDPAAMAQLGLEWRRLPLADRTAPTNELVRSILDWLQLAERDDRVLYLHCEGGRGRAATVAVGLLVYEGLPVGDALRIVMAAHPAASPTEAQRQWIESLAPSRAAPRSGEQPPIGPSA